MRQRDPALGSALLLDVASAAETYGMNAPCDWHRFDRAQTEALAADIERVHDWHDAHTRREPVDVIARRDWFVERLTEGPSATIESLSTAITGGFTEHVDHVAAFDDAGASLPALVSILDRVGWPDDWRYGSRDADRLRAR